MRAAAVQLNATDDKQRNLATAERLVRAAAADGAQLVVLPEKWSFIGAPEDVPAARRAARRPHDHVGARDRARAGHRPASPARSSSASRARRSPPTPASTSGPTARSTRSTARSTCSTSRSSGTVYRESATEEPGDEIVLSETADGVEPGPDRLLRPALPRALPDPRRPRRADPHRPRRLHAHDDARPLGGRCCARGRSRTRPSSSRPTRSATHPPGHRSGGRSMIVDPWGLVLALAPDSETHIVADLDFDAPGRHPHASCRRSPTAGRRPTPGPRRSTPDGRLARPGGRRQAPRHPRRGGARVRAPGLPHLPRVGHRRRGGRRLRPRLPLLRVQGRDPRHALPRALGRHARGDPRDRPPAR